MTKFKIILIILAVALCGWGVFYLSQTQTVLEEEKEEKVKRVQAQKIGNLQSIEGQIVGYGQVVSVTGVDVVPEIGGVVKKVYKSLGSVVRPGDIIFELQNSSQNQAIQQARAGVSQLQANLSKISGDAGLETIAQAESSLVSQESALVQAQQSTLSSLDVLYESLDRVLSKEIDARFFTNVNTNYPDLRFETEIEIQARELETQRATVQSSLEENRMYDDSDDAIIQYKKQVQVIRDLRDSILSQVEQLKSGGSVSQNTIDGYKADLALIQSELAALTSQALALQASLRERRQAVISAQVALQEIKDGADDEDIAIARSQLSQSEANLASAVIAYEKTRVKAPVLGTISNIDVRVGSLVGSSPVVTIENENALRIDTKITTLEAERISVGDEVVVDGSHKGRVSIISPSIDENTGKISVQILLDDQDVRVTSGMGVGIVFNTTNLDEDSKSEIRIPIEAVFVRGKDQFVYLFKDNKAVSTKVVVPTLFGEDVIVSDGLSVDDVVILSARGVKDNETVEIIIQ